MQTQILIHSKNTYLNIIYNIKIEQTVEAFLRDNLGIREQGEVCHYIDVCSYTDTVDSETLRRRVNEIPLIEIYVEARKGYNNMTYAVIILMGDG